MFFASSRNRLNKNCPTARTRACLAKTGRNRPRLEYLEDRTVPTMIRWVNPASGFWNVATNWDLQRLPTADDDVVIDLPGSYMVTCNSPSQAKSVFSTHPFTLAGTLLRVAEQFRVDAAFQLSGAIL